MQTLLKHFCIKALLFFSFILAGCAGGKESSGTGDGTAPDYLLIEERGDSSYRVVSVSPFDGSRDTLDVDSPLRSLVVMSTTCIGFLDAIGCDSVVTGVSGLKYVCSGNILRAAEEGRVRDIGYDAAPDYETILSLEPDLVLSYSVSGEESRFVKKLRSLGIRVFCVNEHLEAHPLARASYVRLFGALTGKMHEADSVLEKVSGNYLRISAQACGNPRRVLMNIPYSDQWFIPGGESYMTHLVEDAGGIVLGAVEGRRESSVISLEQAFSLASEADCWLNVGWCSTIPQLERENPIFKDILEVIGRNAAARESGGGDPVWNCTLRQSPAGGNDFWESGVVRPDLILSDLVGIFNGDNAEKFYYRPVRR
ncbi:MAG: ABC transporter substrate-binding protein [Candidatus Cryptobacteroides sp.]